MRRASGALLVALFSLMFACNDKPSAGAKCTEANIAVCVDTTSALLCRSGAWESVPCKGLKGCQHKGRDVSCDDFLADEGDACMGGVSDDFACSVDRKTLLVCRENRFQMWRHCRGPKVCAISTNEVTCDVSLGEPNYPCDSPGGYACSVDHKFLLICREGKLHYTTSCRGPKACVFDAQTKRASCDDSVSREGDPCERTDEHLCSDDHAMELVCRSKKFVKDKECRRSGGCEKKGGRILCNDPVRVQ